MLTTDQKGAIAEMAIASQATKLGIEVYRPVAEGGRFDMIFVVGNDLLRVQCKSAALHENVLVVRCYSCRAVRAGDRKRRYTRAEIDAIAAYSIDLDRCFYLPIDAIADRHDVRLRLAPARNNQRRLMTWAEDYDFDARLTRLGAVAQLGERQSGTLEVTGSIPVGSTLLDGPPPV